VTANDDYLRGYRDGYRDGLLGVRTGDRVDITPSAPASKAKKTRKVSAYSRRYGAEYKRLKRKHPRIKFGALSKKAHAATRKAMK